MKVTTKSERVDTTDAADLADTIRSPGFALIHERLTLLLEQYTAALRYAESWDRVLNLQGSIKAVECALEVPNILRTELANALRDKR